MAEKPYKVIIEGANGAGSQVFEAETPEELQTQFQQAQTHATAKIREQAQELEQLRQRELEREKPPANGHTQDDEISKAWKQGIATAFGLPFDTLAQKLAKMDQVTSIQERSFVNQSLAVKHPELLEVSQEDDLHNGTVISKIVEELGGNYTESIADAAFALGKQRGLLKLKLVPVGEEVALTPVPTTVSRPAAAANTSESEEHFLRTAPVEKVREYLEKKHAAGQRA